ncbi:MAG TPA: hypothetical protein VIF43_01480 [Patescibacteria group bacterium]|jgi:hypothetical protein
MSAETPKPNAVERETPAERKAAYAEFRSSLADRFVFHGERAVEYSNLAVDVRQLGELLKDGRFSYVEVEMSEDPQSGEAKLDKVSMLVPDTETGDYKDGATIYEAYLPVGEVRKFELHRNLSFGETQRAEAGSAKATAMMVMTESTIQLARREILMDKPEGYKGELASVAEVRKLLGSLQG